MIGRRKPGFRTGVVGRMKMMRIALVSPVLLDVSGRRDEAHRGARRALHRRGSSRPRARAVRSGRHVRRAVLHRGATSAAAARARLPGLAGPHRRLQGQRRGVQPVDHPLRRGHRCSPSCAPAATTSSTSTSRSRRWAAGSRPTDPAAAGRHLPLLLGEPRPQRAGQPDGRAPGAQPAARPDRRLRGGGVDRQALLRRPLPGDPQRRARRSRRSWPRPAASRRPSACGSCSSARPSSARACRCCCAPSRRCASTSPPS